MEIISSKFNLYQNSLLQLIQQRAYQLTGKIFFNNKFYKRIPSNSCFEVIVKQFVRGFIAALEEETTKGHGMHSVPTKESVELARFTRDINAAEGVVKVFRCAPLLRV